MTCIVAVEHNGTVHMGGDRGASSDTYIGVHATPKVFYVGQLLIGYSQSFRLGQVLQHALNIPPRVEGQDLDEWLTLMLIPAIRNTFKDAGVERTEDGMAAGGTFLLATEGRCFEVQAEYSLLQVINGEYAIGAGQDYAYGSLHSTRGDKPAKRVKAALEAAGEYAPSVRGPFDHATI